MDIVTNVMGALFFVVVFAALSSFGAKGKVITPVLSETDTEAIIVECRDNTVYFPDAEGLQKRVAERWEEADKKGLTDWDEKVQYLRDGKIENEFYRFLPETIVTPTASGRNYSLTVTLVPKVQNYGESLLQLEKSESNYNKALGNLDPSQKHLFFLVDTDSFEVFHAARRHAVKSGFRVGWDPIALASPLRFASGGVVDVGTVF